MKSKLLMMTVAIVFVYGCTAYQGPDASQGAQSPGARPAKVYAEGEGQAQAAGAGDQSAAPGQESGRREPAPPETAAKTPGEKEAKAEAVKAATPAPGEAEKQAELSVEYLIQKLESKPSLTLAEQDAYRKLCEIPPEPQPPAGTSDLYSLLGQARDAVVKGDYEAARERAAQALVQLRSRTSPVIDAVYFATKVQSYGNAEVISPAELSAGQRVLLVTDISSFTCESAGTANPPELYTTKMSQRVAIYDANWKLVWQKSYEAQEYQSTHYISTMFIPRIFNLPAGMKSGEYTAKVEIVDALSNKQAETGIRFTIK